MGSIVEDITMYVKAVAHIKLDPDHDVPEMQVPFLDRAFQPTQVRIEYIFGPGQHRGWWVATSIHVNGPRVLKPAADGTQRLGKDRHKCAFDTYGGADVQTKHDLPEWLDTLVSESRPTGQVSTRRMAD